MPTEIGPWIGRKLNEAAPVRVMSRALEERKKEVKDELVEKLIELESDIRYQEYASDSEPEYLHVTGTRPILISAPHGAVHTRNGDKEEDEYTAGLARLVGGRTGAHVIYARRKSRTDPNADLAAPYKESLQRIVQDNNINFVVDLHGANENRNFGVALGTMHGKSCSTREKQTIIGVFEKYGISEAGNGFSRLDIDNQLPGEGDDHREPIIRYCHSIFLPAAQLEINAKLRIPIRRDDATHHDVHFSGDQELIIILIEALSDIVASLAER